MKIILAGGAGYIGSALVPVLLDNDCSIKVIDLLWFGNYLPKGVNIIRKDLFDCTVDDLLGYDQVVFLAGLSNDPMAEFNPAKNFILNGALPSYLAFIAKKAGVKRFIYASSCSVYGFTGNKFYSEADRTVCNYPYGIAKLQGERGVLQMKDNEYSVIVLRQGTVCGHSPRMRMDLIVNTMFKTAMTEGRIVINNPSIWRPICDIRDTINAFIASIQIDKSISGIFNIASGNYTIVQVGTLVKKEIEKFTKKEIALEINNIQDIRNYKVGIKKAKMELGFKPKYTIEDIVKQLYDNKSYYDDYNKDVFYNIQTFRKLSF